MLGTGIGDAIGRSSEGGTMLQLESIRKTAEESDVLRYTDDTQQMISLAEALAEKGEFDGKTFGERLVENFNPSRGYGPGSTQVIRAIERGEAWDKPARKLFGGEGSYGNGSSMRAAPAGLFCYDDLENLRSFARDCSRITHTHRLGVEGSILQTAAVALATRQDPSLSFDSKDFLEKIQEFIEEKEYREKLNWINEFLDSEPSRKEIVRTLGNGVEAFNSVPTAVYSFLSHPESFEDAVIYAVSLGGDADTIGAMTGAIVGSYQGADEIPDGWKEKLEDRDKIITLANKLLEAKKSN